MTQDDVIRTSPPICALDFGVPAEFAERAESYARWAVAQEREKRTGIQEFVTLPREVVEQALKVLEYAANDVLTGRNAATELRAALEQPQNHIEQHLGMVKAGWKMVPEEPTLEMIEAGDHEIEKWGVDASSSGAFRAMLAAAPQPPTVKECLTVDHPQANQPAMTPIAQRKLEDLMASGYTISGYSIYNEQKHQHGFVTGAGLVGWWKPEGVEYPQPKREPLTDNQIDKIAESMPGGLEGFLKGWGWRQFARAVLENDHNIK